VAGPSAPRVVLAPVTEENIGAVLTLVLAPGQEKWVANNERSLAQAYAYRWLRPAAIVAGGTVVGFLMHGRHPETGRHSLHRIMVDERHQGNGYATEAIQVLVAEVRAEGRTDALFLSYVPGNEEAVRVYERLGFVHTGESDEDGELIMRLQL
jgi:diamine N-acetyltransferase